MENNYGKITVGYGTPEQAQIPIKDYVAAFFGEDRAVKVAGIEDGTIALSVINKPESGRSSQSIWVHEESAIALLMTMHLYFLAKGVDIHELLNGATSGEGIGYEYSENLTNPFSE